MPGKVKDRQRWMAVLAKTPVRRLEKEWLRMELKPEYDFLRRPETGAVMVQGRVGGTGQGFNLGEMTVTRCTVKSGEGSTGSAYVMGRSHRHAELAALFDSLLQVKGRHVELMEQVISPLAAELKAVKDMHSRKAAATKVDFFTMVRGE
ncbi:MAG: phosphonate C-P lyase system protein PhnG [Desulfosarcina sp.]|nr:phosphonate C-P lyase system protein PhnG [Desulfobacterales bacterium]